MAVKLFVIENPGKQGVMVYRLAGTYADCQNYRAYLLAEGFPHKTIVITTE